MDSPTPRNHPPSALNFWPGKQAARRIWLDEVIDELESAHELCLACAMPGLAARIARASSEALKLRDRS